MTFYEEGSQGLTLRNAGEKSLQTKVTKIGIMLCIHHLYDHSPPVYSFLD